MKRGFGDDRGIDSITGLIAIGEERIYLFVDPGFMRAVERDPRFGAAPGGLYYPYTRSFKLGHYRKGTLQLSFVPGSGRVVDVDHDLFGPGLAHLFSEVVPNKISVKLNECTLPHVMIQKSEFERYRDGTALRHPLISDSLV